MLCVVYKCSVFVYMNKLSSISSSPSYSLVVLVINFCIVEPFNFTLYTKRTYIHNYACDTNGLITANSTCPFGTSWSQLSTCAPTDDHVSSNGGHCARMDGGMPQTAALDPALLMYIRTVRVHATRMYRLIDV